jgi:uncharacterized membrane protein YkvA (DUF1232 family)
MTKQMKVYFLHVVPYWKGWTMDIREKINKIKEGLLVLTIALKRKETPLYAKAMIAFTLCYALSPIDLIPDFIPVLGYLDDFIILPLLMILSIKMIPKDHYILCLKIADEEKNKPLKKKWYYGILIVILWLIIAIGIFNWVK